MSVVCQKLPHESYQTKAYNKVQTYTTFVFV